MADQANTPAPQNRASHVRSFAKDVAAASGKKPKDANMTPVVAPPPVEPTPAPVVEPKPTPAPPVKIVSAAPILPGAEVPGTTPLPPLPPTPIPPAPPKDDEVRAAVLARLRARAAGEPVPTASPVAPPPPIPLSKPATPPRPAPIHTYKSDFAEHIDDKNASVFSVLAAEKDSGVKAPEALAAQKKDRTKFIVGGMLILLGLFGLYAAYRWSQDLSVIPTEQAVPSLVFADARTEITGTGNELMRNLANAATPDLDPGSVLITYITTATTTEKSDIIRFPQPGGVLVRALELPAPSILLRNIEDVSTVGVVRTEQDAHAFFVLRVSSFERTFAGMLEWEVDMVGDLAILYPAYPVDPVVAPTTGTTTPAEVIPPPRFVDDVVASRDVRALRDYRERTILLYGYRDKETLIIARDEAAFAELVSRLTATAAP
ncbi:hypothetical protein K2Y00_02500 [Patescibacteria group bacterium]|nr:hypothetical protein [Patescibacteria group bacterium]